MPFATHPVRRVAAAKGIRLSGDWPYNIPAVHQLLTDGLDLDPGVTFQQPRRRRGSHHVG
ncbi:hypothetical protein [Kribbella solani]|uniref:Uncharacterized protein n=1 Tax=Kribbella solani TaxID=236067 RepID=A0A841E4D0_9ACTN|nr:hypothetical protein [Kribbella solani]MBB5983845.1 hypothetical protein [Kribbella solani]